MYRERFLLLLLYHSAQLNHGGRRKEESQRAERILNLFNIVSFPNDVCSSSDSDNKYGTCYAASECSAAGAADVNWMFGKSEWKYNCDLFIQEASPRVAAPVGSECAASSQEGNIISGR